MLYFLYPSTLDRYLRDYQGEKSWALVTGSSDGIGKGIAHELCSHGFNVVLHGRNAEKLSRVQSSLLAEYPNVQVRNSTYTSAPADITTQRAKSHHEHWVHLRGWYAVAERLLAYKSLYARVQQGIGLRAESEPPQS
jgi:NAD(P)-dependent dehydrogenase (short-subunit alcohol dehydrogenase family)